MKQKKQIKVYSFRQFYKTIEKEQQKKEYVKTYYPIKEETIKYRTGKTQVIYRRNGRFIKRTEGKIGIAKQKQIPEKDDFYKSGRLANQITDFYRASVAINGIPINRKYYSATIIKIAKLENININDMIKELIERLEKDLHYKEFDWWFNHKALLQIQEPKPYFGYERGTSYEFHKV